MRQNDHYTSAFIYLSLYSKATPRNDRITQILRNSGKISQAISVFRYFMFYQRGSDLEIPISFASPTHQYSQFLRRCATTFRPLLTFDCAYPPGPTLAVAPETSNSANVPPSMQTTQKVSDQKVTASAGQIRVVFRLPLFHILRPFWHRFWH